MVRAEFERVPNLDIEHEQENVDSGRSSLYRVQGDGYAGLCIIRRIEFMGEGCCVIDAAAGFGVPGALADIKRLVEPLGMSRILIDSPTPAHHRLYERAGFREHSRIYLG